MGAGAVERTSGLPVGAGLMNPVCPVCGLRHITVTRPEGLGFCHRYREVDEHYHESYEELLVCQGDYTPGQYLKAANAAQRRTGGRGRHPRKTAHDRAVMPVAPEKVGA